MKTKYLQEKVRDYTCRIYAYKHELNMIKGIVSRLLLEIDWQVDQLYKFEKNLGESEFEK